MIDKDGFKTWLKDNTEYSPAVLSDQVCRMNRADGIREWDGEETYLFYLEKEERFCEMTVSVRSQMRKAVKLYSAYAKALSEMAKK